MKPNFYHPIPDVEQLSRFDWFSNNTIETFIDCQRMAWWQYMKVLDSGESPSMSAGSVIHAAVETWHKTKDLQLATHHLESVNDKHRASLEVEANRLSEGNLKRIFTAYTARYANDMVSYLEQEFNFAIWLGGDCDSSGPFCSCGPQDPQRCFYLIGRFDGIVIYQNYLWPHEVKTTASVGDSYLEGLSLSRQPISYVYAVKQLVENMKVEGLKLPPVKGCLYDVIGISPTKTEMTRFPVMVSDAVLAEWEAELRETVAEFRIKFGKTSGKLPTKNRRQCTRYGKCAFIPLCRASAGFRIEDPLPDLAQTYKRRVFKNA